MRAFLCSGSSLLFHYIDWCFVDGSYLKTHNSRRDDQSKKHCIRLAIVQKCFCNEDSVLSSVPASKLSKPVSNTPSCPNSDVEFYAYSYAKYRYCQRHLWSFSGGPSWFLVSLLYFACSCRSTSSSIIAHWFSSALEMWPTHFFTVVLFNTCVQYTLVSSFITLAFVLFFRIGI